MLAIDIILIAYNHQPFIQIHKLCIMYLAHLLKLCCAKLCSVFLTLLVLLNKLACELNERMTSFCQSVMVSRSSFVNAMHFLQCHSESFRHVQRGSVELEKINETCLERRKSRISARRGRDWECFVNMKDWFIHNGNPRTPDITACLRSMTTLVPSDGAEDNGFKCAPSEFFKLLNPHWGGLFVLWLWRWHTSVCCVFQHPDEKRLEGLSKQLDWDVRTIQRWFRQRRNQEKPSTLARFCESMWESAVLRNLVFVRAWFAIVLQEAYCRDICQVVGTFFNGMKMH